MNRTHINRIVDACAGAAGILSIFTGFLLRGFFPHPGSGRGDLILSHAGLYNLHLAVSLAAVFCILLHLLLHLHWIRGCLRRMPKNHRVRINFGTDLAGVLAGIFLLISGIVLWRVYPLGIPGKGRILFLDQQYPWWYDLHFAAAVFFTIFFAIHLILHWEWIKRSCLRRP